MNPNFFCTLCGAFSQAIRSVKDSDQEGLGFGGLPLR